MGYTDGLKPLLGKKVEIYQGDSHETLLKADKDIARKSVIRGTLAEINGDCVVVECPVGNQTTRVYINGWSISTVVEPSPGIGIFTLYQEAEFRKSKK